MATIRTMFLAAAFSLATLVGCSSSTSSTSSGGSSAGAPNFDNLQTTLTTPTGTFAAGSEAKVVDGFGQKVASMTGGLSFLGGGSESSTKSESDLAFAALNILAETSCDALKAASGTGTCACATSGTVAYEIPAGGLDGLDSKSDAPVDGTLSLRPSACNDGKKTVDGSLYIRVKKTNAKNGLIIYSIRLSIVGGEKPGTYDVDVLFESKDGKSTIVFAVDVPDGKVLVSGSYDANTGNGSITIKDKQGEYTCTATNGVGKCNTPDGKTREGIKFKL
jgi:hypothetical protein